VRDSPVQIVGNKAVLEARGEGQTFKAGTYRNRSISLQTCLELHLGSSAARLLTLPWCCRVVMVLEFSPATGKIVRLNEYLDTAALYAVMDAHGV